MVVGGAAVGGIRATKNSTATLHNFHRVEGYRIAVLVIIAVAVVAVVVVAVEVVAMVAVAVAVVVVVVVVVALSGSRCRCRFFRSGANGRQNVVHGNSWNPQKATEIPCTRLDPLASQGPPGLANRWCRGTQIERFRS